MYRSVVCGFVLLFVLGVAGTVRAADESSQSDVQSAWAASFYVENDMFGGTDQHYTNAVKLSLMSDDLGRYSDNAFVEDNLMWLVGLMKKTPLMKYGGDIKNLSFSIGNAMYTPVDTKEPSLIVEDRPYAGWTYAAFGLHAKNATQLDSVELSLGVVGPSAKSDFVQDTWHDLINKFRSEGWDNQIHDEPGIVLSRFRTWRQYWDLGSGFGADVMPHVGGALGNVHTYAAAGGLARWGYHVPQDFGVSLLRPGTAVPAPVADSDIRLTGGWGWNVFFGAEGRLVGRNIFLDGNTWRKSHRVKKKMWVVDAYGGVSLLYDKFSITYTHAYRSEEFEEQTGGQVFGSISVGMTF